MTSPPTLEKHRLCPTCGRALIPTGGCRRCAMAGALEALHEASDSDWQREPEPELEVAVETPVSPRGFSAFAPPELPWRFAEFEVRRKIASGGMGTVYEAEDLRLGRSVALKMIRSFAFSSPEEKVRFKAEAEAAAALDHPHIIPIYQVGEALGQPYFTMKLIEGGTLADLLKQGPLPPGAAVRLMSKVAQAVHHAHQRGVLHRDLKPGNILLDAQGEPYLTDFGLAKLLNHDQMLTLSQAQVGTPQYMSPEQAAGRSREISTESDVWSLGAIFYEMLSGHRPFQGGSSAEILRQILDSEPPRLYSGVTRASGADRDLSTIVARCLEKDPARRPPSAEFLVEELDRWLRGVPIRSRAISASERGWRWIRRHKTAAASIAVTGVALIAGTGVSIWQAARATRAQHEAERQLVDADAAARVIFSTLSNFYQDSSEPLVDREKFVTDMVRNVEGYAGDPVRKANLLSALSNTLPPEKAIDVAAKAAALAEANFPPDDPQLWYHRLVLAHHHISVEARRVEGNAGLRRILAWRRQHLGAEDPGTLYVAATLAHSLNNQQEFDESVELLAEVHRVAELRPGDFDKGKRSFICFDYARALFNTGHREQALDLGRTNVPRTITECGGNSHVAGRAAMHHAALCRKAGLLKEATAAARQALTSFWGSGGPQSIFSLHALRALADIQREAKDTTGLLATLREALREFDIRVGGTHPATAVRVREYARALISAGQLEEAEQLCLHWLRRLREGGRLTRDGEPVLRAHVEVLLRGKDLARAEAATRELMALVKDADPRGLNYLTDQSTLGSLLMRQERFAEAEPLLEEVIELLEKRGDENPPLKALRIPEAKRRLEECRRLQAAKG